MTQDPALLTAHELQARKSQLGQAVIHLAVLSASIRSGLRIGCGLARGGYEVFACFHPGRRTLADGLTEGQAIQFLDALGFDQAFRTLPVDPMRLARAIHAQAQGPSAWGQLTDDGREYYSTRAVEAIRSALEDQADA